MFAIRLLVPALLIAATVRDGMASFISISAASPTLAPGQSETISFLFTSTQNFSLLTGSFGFTYDNTRFTLTSSAPGSLLFGGTSGSSTTLTRGFNFGSGVFTINGNGAPITVGEVGPLATFTLMALATAPVGGNLGNINLQASFDPGSGPITTQLNGGAIILTPAPTNGFDPTLDATVSVTGAAAVPEPSSLALCGLAGLSGLGYAWRRRKRSAA